MEGAGHVGQAKSEGSTHRDRLLVDQVFEEVEVAPTLPSPKGGGKIAPSRRGGGEIVRERAPVEEPDVSRLYSVALGQPIELRLPRHAQVRLS